MLPLTGGNDSREALENGAYQRATLTVYDAADSSHGYPQIAQFANANIISGSLTVSKSGISSNRLEFGACVSDELRVRIRSSSLANLNLLGQMIKLSVEWDYDGTYSPEVVYPFSGIVIEVKHLQDDVYSLTALDSLIAFDKPYKQSEVFDHSTGMNLAFPVSVFDLVWDIAVSVATPYIAHTGITVPSDYASTFPNYAKNIYGIAEDQGYTYRDILRWCAQIMGCNVGVDAGLRQVKLYLTTDTNITYDEGNNFYRSTFGEKPTVLYGKYTCIVNRNGRTVYDARTSDDIRAIIVSDNMLITSDAEGNAIGGRLNTHYLSFSLIPDDTVDFTGTSVPLWYLEPFDIIHFADGEVVLITSVQHKLNGSSIIEAKTVPETAFYSPSKAFSTPQQAALAAGREQIKTDLMNLLCYQPGDSFMGEAFFFGYLSGSRKVLLVTIPLQKMIVTTPTISSCVVHARVPAGGWLDGNSSIDVTNIISSVDIWGNTITLHIASTTAYGSVDNIPVNGHVNINITF